MPFNINLYHEVLRTRREEQYDPLRLSMIGLGVIVACLAGYYFLALAGKSAVVGEYEAKQREFDELTPKVAAAVKEEEEINKTLGLAEKMTRRIEDRFYWGPVFEQIAVSVPPTVQITRCNGDAGNDVTRKVQITMDGIAAGDEPFRVAENLRVKLIETLGSRYKNVNATLKTLDLKTSESGAVKVSYGDKTLPTAQFSMYITFVPMAVAEPAPPPAPKRSKRIAQGKEE